MIRRPPPTASQLAFVAFWARFTDEHGYPPTLREAGAAFGISSTNAVTSRINFVVLKGLLVRSAADARGTVVTDLGRALVGAPPRKPLVATGTVIPESKCPCGKSFFAVDRRALCRDCERAA